MINRINEAVCRYGMEKIYGGAIVGFSGGADSGALLHYLKDRCSNLLAVHINHKIRGEEAERDEAFCRSVCEKYGVELRVFKIDIPAIAKERRQGLEETAREERYRVFKEILKDNPRYGCIVTAHNANDNGETVVFNLARGTGINGLCGIKPVVGDVYRPLIYSTRDDIIKYCRDNNIEYVTDSTNEDTDYTRNRIRHEVLPELLKINSGFLNSCIRLGEILRRDEEYISREAEAVVSSLAGGHLPKETSLSLDGAVLSRVLKALSGRNLEYATVEACFSLIKNWKTGKMINIEGGLTFKLERDYCLFIKTEETCAREFFSPLTEGINEINDTGAVICINCTLEKEGYIKDGSVRLDADEIVGSLYVRSRCEGDTVRSGGMTKKLKRILSDRHVPSHKRDLVPVICDEAGVLAIPGMVARDGAFCKNGEKEKKNIITINIYSRINNSADGGIDEEKK